MVKRFINYISSIFQSKEEIEIKKVTTLDTGLEFHDFYKNFDFSSLKSLTGRELKQRRTLLLFTCLQEFIEICNLFHKFNLNLSVNRNDSVMSSFRRTSNKNKKVARYITSLEKEELVGNLVVWKRIGTDEAFFGVVQKANKDSIKFLLPNEKGKIEVKTISLSNGEFELEGFIFPFDSRVINSRR